MPHARICKKCGDQFTVKHVNTNKLFCSKKCFLKDWYVRQKSRGISNGTFQRRKVRGLCTLCGQSTTNKWICDACVPVHRARERAYKVKLKRDVIAAYGGKCACCGECRFEFMTIDHISGRGKNEDIATYGKTGRGGHGLYTHLRKRGYPKDNYRLLCSNCNLAFGFYGQCPHEREKADELLNNNPVKLQVISGGG